MFSKQRAHAGVADYHNYYHCQTVGLYVTTSYDSDDAAVSRVL